MLKNFSIQTRKFASVIATSSVLVGTFVTPTFAMDETSISKSNNFLDTEEKHKYCGRISTYLKDGKENPLILSGSCTAIGKVDAKEGRKAILLTAAHNFIPLFAGAPSIVTVSFSANPTLPGAPYYNIESIYYPKKYLEEESLDKTDICLAVTTLLPKSTIIPALSVYKGNNPSNELFEGIMVGYGNMYGPRFTTESSHTERRRCCLSYAAFQEYGKGDSAYETLLKSAITLKKLLSASETTLESFEDTSSRDISLPTRGLVRCHPKQAILASGCSGGPLIRETENGPCVIGVFSKIDTDSFSKVEGMPLVSMSFVPILTNPWIIEVINKLQNEGDYVENEIVGKALINL